MPDQPDSTRRYGVVSTTATIPLSTLSVIAEYPDDSDVAWAIRDLVSSMWAAIHDAKLGPDS